MVRLQIEWCKHCPHKVALHPKSPKWWHFAVGRGYGLTLNCLAYGGSTNTSLDLGAFRSSQFKCDCLTPEPDPGKPMTSKWVLV